MTFGYTPDLTRHVMQAVQQHGADILGERYDARCLLDMAVPSGGADALAQALLRIHGVEQDSPQTDFFRVT